MAAEAQRRGGDDRLLPPEVWSEILYRLPTKSILQCRSVCKSWYSLVSCPHFISRNLNKNGNRFLLQLYDDGSNVCSFSSHDEWFMESREHDEVPEAFLGSINVRIVGSCNGLICLSKYGHGDPEVTFLIWNPTIRKVVELPSPTITSSPPNFSYFGFGFDSKTNDHKVLCMCTDVLSNVCDIYDSNKGVWRGVSPTVHPWKVGRPASECYLNGAAHWTGYRHGMSTVKILLSFDMSDEIFREIRMPDCAEFNGYGHDDDDDDSTQTRSVTFGGLIHVIVWDMNRVVGMSENCSVWAMKEYGVTESWAKLFNIFVLSDEDSPTYQPLSFCLRENDEVLMVHDYSILADVYQRFGYMEDLILYNTRNRTYRRLSSFDKHVSSVCLYEESLFLM